MAAKALDSGIAQDVVADWRTGEYSYREIADRNKISKAKVGQLCKGVEQDLKGIVDAGVAYRAGIANQDRRIVDAINDVVDDRTKHLLFFNKAQARFAQISIQAIESKLEPDGTPGPEFNLMELATASRVVKESREGILGKDPSVALQVNNNNGTFESILQKVRRD